MKTEILSYNKDEFGGVYIGHEPVAKPRMTRQDKWKKRPCVMRYRAFCNILKLVDNRLDGYLKDILDGGQVDIVFFLPIPESRKKENSEGDPHQVKPDVDNCVKTIFDALCKNDSHIYEVRARKQYTEAQPGVRIGTI